MKRKSFLYKGIWRYNFTISWIGRDEQDAFNNKQVFEVELEFIDRKRQNIDCAYVGLTMLEKVIDFLDTARSNETTFYEIK